MGFFRDRDFLFLARSKIFGFLRFSEHRDFFGIFGKSPGYGIFSGFLENPRDSGFFQSRNFYPRDSGFFESRDFYPRDFLPSGYPRDRDFFRGMGYPDKKPTLLIITFQKK